jgi:hypothetical protein
MRRITIGAILLGVCGFALFGYFVLRGRPVSADAPPIGGTWTLVSVKDANGNTKTPPSHIHLTYAFDMVAEEMTVTTTVDESATALEQFVVPFSINEQDNLEFDDGAGHSLEMSAGVNGTTLTLTRVSYSGSNPGADPAPYLSGQQPGTSSPMAGPPQQVVLTR